MKRQSIRERVGARLAFDLGAPLADLARSPAARRVAWAAEKAGLFLFDYERRVQLELPEAWLPAGRPDLGVTGQPPAWERGVLGESKYLAFRHDTLLGSLHAGQRAKWTAHELCHGLVGFCWRPDGSMLFHALAARLAEALPVALWYFFDEAGCARCVRHMLQSELGPSFCAACEATAARAATLPDMLHDAEDPEWIARGREFLAREIDAVRRSIATGRPVFTPHGAIDLMTDGLAYASAHAPRLRAIETATAFAHTFPGERGAASGWFDDLEAFAAHVEALADHVAGGPEPATLPRYGKWRLVAQDLGARLAQVAADTDGECRSELVRLIEALAAGTEEAVESVSRGYHDLSLAYELPWPDEVFAVGYALPSGEGFGVEQVRAGLESCMAATLRLLGERSGEVVRAFAHGVWESVTREPLARRFAAFLRRQGGSRELLGLADLEAAIACAVPPDPIELGLGLDGAMTDALRLPTGVELVRPGFDAGGLFMRGKAAKPGPGAFLVRRDAADQVGLIAVSEALAERLARGPLDAATTIAEAVEDTELAALLDEGLLVPAGWSLTLDEPDSD